jgi:uncharacterized iron-regulated membrane protein
LKSFLLVVHRWTGLAAGLFVSLIGLSGSILVIHAAFEHAHSRGPVLTIDSLFAIAAKGRATGFSTCEFDLPPSPGRPLTFTFTAPQENLYSRARTFVDIDPASGAALREGSCSDMSASFIQWLMYFHDSFHAGRAGMLAAALAAIAMGVSILTGIFIHGKNILRILIFRFPLRGKTRAQFFRGLHLYLSIWGLAVNVVVMTTGLWMMRGTLTPEAWNCEPPPRNAQIGVSIDSCIRASRDILPGFQPGFVDVPLTGEGELEIDGDMEGGSQLSEGDASSVVFDASSGILVRSFDATKSGPAQTLTQAAWPLHTGNYGGWTVRLLYVLAGLIPGLLFVSGVIVWRSTT